MHLDIAQREREGIILLDLKGRIVAGEEVAALRSIIEELTAVEGRKIVINLQAVDYIDSLGLGAIVSCQTRLRKVSGLAKLIHLNRRNLELLLMTKIDTIFEVFDDETDAVNSFFPDRQIKPFDILSFVQKLKAEGAGGN